MKVGELIAQLNKFDPNFDILCYTEDEKLVSGRNGFRLLEIMTSEIVEGEKIRINQEPYLKLGKTSSSERHVVLVVTSDF